MQRQRRILSLGNLPTDVRNLILRLLVGELEDAWFGAWGVSFRCLARFLRAGFLGFGGGVDIGVLMPRSVVGGDDGVPDYGFGLRDAGGVRGGVGGGDVEEDLFGVPVEEGRQICRQPCQIPETSCEVGSKRTGVQVELDVRVLFALGAVVVWAALDSAIL